MTDDLGIIETKFNPFVPKKRRPEVEGWIEQRRPLTKHRKDQLEKLWNLNIESIKSQTEFDAPYVAFTAIRWGFAKMDNEKKLTATNIWRDKDLYDDRGILKGGEPEAISNSINYKKHKDRSKGPMSLPSPMQRDELVYKLGMFQADPVIERYLAKDHLIEKTAGEILIFSFDHTIYRAFPVENPTSRYKEWRWYSNSNKLCEELDTLRSQDDFDKFLIEFGESLVIDWVQLKNINQPSKMNIGYALKISNLIIKHIVLSKHTCNPNLKEWLHVPWDSFTLNPLREIYQGYPPIPKKPSQGFVKNLSIYQELHTFISCIAKEAGVNRINYEFLIWDAAHS